jgi:putative phosphoesterase
MIYVISDTHIPERASELPRKFVEKIKKEDIIFHAGDFTSLKTYRELENLATLYAVCGNMDCPEIKELLPSKKIIEFSGFIVGLIHGSGSPFNLTEKVYKEFSQELDLIILGHSHTPYNQKFGEILLFNPGSLAGNFLSWQKSYGILHTDRSKIWGEHVYIK